MEPAVDVDWRLEQLRVAFHLTWPSEQYNSLRVISFPVIAAQGHTASVPANKAKTALSFITCIQKPLNISSARSGG